MVNRRIDTSDRLIKNKNVLVGVIDVGTEEVETAEVVAGRICALPHVTAERLFPCTDCGLVPRSRGARQDGARVGSGHGSTELGA